MANQSYRYPASGGAAGSNASVAPNGGPIPTSSTLIAGKGPTGLETPISVDSSGNENVNVVSSALPTGAATSANQALEIADLDAIKASTAASATAANQATEITKLTSIDTKTPALGQAVAASSVPVVLTAAQLTTLTPLSTVAVSNFPATQAVSGSVAVTNFPATQPVSGSVAVTSLPSIPAGANAIGSVSVSNFPATQAISAASLPLPTGAATSALQTTISGQLPTTLGQKTSAASLAVVLASDQSTLPTTQGGKSVANAPVYNIYSTTNVLTTAYVQLVASTTALVNMIEIFDSSGQSLQLAVGAAGSEIVQLYTSPGGNGQIPLRIPSGSRVSIKALTGAATSGYLTINFYS